MSAEAYGEWNAKKAFTPPNHPKSDDQKQRLKQTLNKSFMFSALEEKDMQLVLGAMKECKVEAEMTFCHQKHFADVYPQNLLYH